MKRIVEVPENYEDEHDWARAGGDIMAFDRLVREGVLTKEVNRPPHDCKRSISLIDYGSDDSWIAKRWRRRPQNEKSV